MGPGAESITVMVTVGHYSPVTLLTLVMPVIPHAVRTGFGALVSAARHSAVNPLYFKNQASDAGRQPTVAGLPATVGCRP